MKIFQRKDYFKTPKIRVNEAIIAQKIRVISEEGEQIGIITCEEGLKIAKEKGLDLIEISPKADPPVCKIDDLGSYMFNIKKAAKKQKLASKQAPLKSIRFGIRISENDLNIKIDKARKFLDKKHPVKILLQFKGRESSHADLGLEKMKKFENNLSEVSKADGEPKRQGNRIILMLRPEKILKKL